MVFGQVEVGAGGPAGHSYRAVVVRGPRPQVLTAARGLRFSGWVGPQEGGYVVLAPWGRHRLVDSGGRDVEDLGSYLVELLGREQGAGQEAVALVVEVVRDRLLSLVLLPGPGREPLRYLSDPSVLDAEDFEEPRGAHHAGDLARAFGVQDAAGTLRDVLAESLDPEHYIESERLGRVLELLGLPMWLVSAWALPRQAWVGPDPRKTTRLGAGVPGAVAPLTSRLVAPVRRVRQLMAGLPDGPRPDGASNGLPEDGLWGTP